MYVRSTSIYPARRTFLPKQELRTKKGKADELEKKKKEVAKDIFCQLAAKKEAALSVGGGGSSALTYSGIVCLPACLPAWLPGCLPACSCVVAHNIGTRMHAKH